MELIEAIITRRSVRKYKLDQIPDQTIRELLETAVWAPNGMNRQPWVFAVVQDRDLLRRISEKAKGRMLDRVKNSPALGRYNNLMADPNFDVFYGAPTLVLIYGSTDAMTFKYDCSMVALTLMLAAWDRGIGSCWVGFAQYACDTPGIKMELDVPEEYELVAPIILGYPEHPPGKNGRKEPRIVSWVK
ncbi:MAG: nitroreductase [Bacillota bacterium]